MTAGRVCGTGTKNRQLGAAAGRGSWAWVSSKVWERVWRIRCEVRDVKARLCRTTKAARVGVRNGGRQGSGAVGSPRRGTYIYGQGEPGERSEGGVATVDAFLESERQWCRVVRGCAEIGRAHV